MSRLIVSKGTEYLIQTEDFQIELLDLSSVQHSKARYPQNVRDFSEYHGYTLEGEYTANQLYQAIDILQETPIWLQLILVLFLDMRLNFRCTGEFIGTTTMPDGTAEPLHLFGPYEFTIIK